MCLARAKRAEPAEMALLCDSKQRSAEKDGQYYEGEHAEFGIDFLAERAQDPNLSPFWNAPTVILITADKTVRFAEIDCALAAENILIAAESLGLGSLIMAFTEFLFVSEKGKKLKKELEVPQGYKHVCMVALGYKDENPSAKPRRKDAINYIR